MALGLHGLGEFDEVVNLAIGDQNDGTVFVVEGLPAALKVDDGQTPHGEADGSIKIKTLAVGAAANQHAIHQPNADLVISVEGSA